MFNFEKFVAWKAWSSRCLLNGCFTLEVRSALVLGESLLGGTGQTIWELRCFAWSVGKTLLGNNLAESNMCNKNQLYWGNCISNSVVDNIILERSIRTFCLVRENLKDKSWERVSHLQFWGRSFQGGIWGIKLLQVFNWGLVWFWGTFLQGKNNQ